MSFLRSLLAILAGFAEFALVLGLLTPVAVRAFGMGSAQGFSMGFLLTSLGYCVAAAALAGYLAALIAGRRELPHAAVLGLMMIGLAVISMRQHGSARPGWYETTIAGCGPIAALFGAGVRRLANSRRS